MTDNKTIQIVLLSRSLPFCCKIFFWYFRLFISETNCSNRSQKYFNGSFIDKGEGLQSIIVNFIETTCIQKIFNVCSEWTDLKNVMYIWKKWNNELKRNEAIQRVWHTFVPMVNYFMCVKNILVQNFLSCWIFNMEI